MKSFIQLPVILALLSVIAFSGVSLYKKISSTPRVTRFFSPLPELQVINFKVL
jgi:hypothetical protein